MNISFRFWARRLLREEEGATLVEYVLLVALIGIVAIGAMSLLGSNASSKLNASASSLQ